MDKNNASKDFLISLYSEHSEWSRHQESQRSNISNLMITIVAVLVGLIGFDNEINFNDLPFSIFVSLLGIFGMVFVYKYYVQFKFHDARVEVYKKMLNDHYSSENLLSLEEDTDILSKSNFSIFSNLNLYKIWFFFHGMIIIFGFFISYIIFRS